jgi:hypothetical protein
MWLIQKNYLLSVQIEMPLENALKSLGYTDLVLFLTIGKSDIYHYKSLSKSAIDFYPRIGKPSRVANNYRNWLATYLNFSGISIGLTKIHRKYISCLNS